MRDTLEKLKAILFCFETYFVNMDNESISSILRKRHGREVLKAIHKFEKVVSKIGKPKLNTSCLVKC